MSEQRISDEELKECADSLTEAVTDLMLDLSDARAELARLREGKGGAIDAKAVEAAARLYAPDETDYGLHARLGFASGARWQSQRPAPAAPTPVAEDACRLATEHAAWSQATFGTDAERDQSGPLEHLLLEAKEAIANPSDVSEFADCYLLILDAARRAGFPYATLIAAARAKLEVNKARQWQKSEKGKPILHVKERDAK